jgi:hypothetical protein
MPNPEQRTIYLIRHSVAGRYCCETVLGLGVSHIWLDQIGPRRRGRRMRTRTVDHQALCMFILFSLGVQSFSNLSFLGQNRMDNLMKAHS